MKLKELMYSSNKNKKELINEIITNVLCMHSINVIFYNMLLKCRFKLIK